MDLVREDSLFGGRKVIVGNPSEELVLESIGNIYIKNGRSSTVLNEVLESINNSSVETLVSQVLIVEDITEVPSDYANGGLVFDLLTSALYIKVNNKLQILVEVLLGQAGYVKKTGDTMTGLLVINTPGLAPLKVVSSTLVQKLNADKLDGYDVNKLAIKAQDETITGSWTHKGATLFDKTVTVNANINLPAGGFFTEGYIGTHKFTSGFTGVGWALTNDITGYTLTVDNLVVRKTMLVYEMVVNKINATNGSMWVSDYGKANASMNVCIWNEYNLQGRYLTDDEGNRVAVNTIGSNDYWGVLYLPDNANIEMGQSEKSVSLYDGIYTFASTYKAVTKNETTEETFEEVLDNPNKDSYVVGDTFNSTVIEESGDNHISLSLYQKQSANLSSTDYIITDRNNKILLIGNGALVIDISSIGELTINGTVFTSDDGEPYLVNMIKIYGNTGALFEGTYTTPDVVYKKSHINIAISKEHLANSRDVPTEDGVFTVFTKLYFLKDPSIGFTDSSNVIEFNLWDEDYFTGITGISDNKFDEELIRAKFLCAPNFDSNNEINIYRLDDAYYYNNSNLVFTYYKYYGIRPYALVKTDLSITTVDGLTNAINTYGLRKYLKGMSVVLFKSENSIPTLQNGDLIRCQRYEGKEVRYYEGFIHEALRKKADDDDDFAAIDKAFGLKDTKSQTNEEESYFYIPVSSSLTIDDIQTEVDYDSELIINISYTDTESYVSPIRRDDVLVRIGNVINSSRQGAVYLTSSDVDSPYIDTIAEVVRPDFSTLYYLPKLKKFKLIYQWGENTGKIREFFLQDEEFTQEYEAGDNEDPELKSAFRKEWEPYVVSKELPKSSLDTSSTTSDILKKRIVGYLSSYGLNVVMKTPENPIKTIYKVSNTELEGFITNDLETPFLHIIETTNNILTVETTENLGTPTSGVGKLIYVINYVMGKLPEDGIQ